MEKQKALGINRYSHFKEEELYSASIDKSLESFSENRSRKNTVE